MERLCKQCKTKLNSYHTGDLCYACQDKKREEMVTDENGLVDVRGYADMLGLHSEEQLRRLARAGVLAPRIPHIKQLLWRKEEIDAWFKREQRKGDVFRRIAQGIVSNMRRCSKDGIIRITTDTIGKKVYGREYVLGTVESGQVEPIKLVKIPIATSKRMLHQLPAKDFPELKGINDWSDLPYNRIHDAFLVRLETYF